MPFSVQCLQHTTSNIPFIPIVEWPMTIVFTRLFCDIFAHSNNSISAPGLGSILSLSKDFFFFFFFFFQSSGACFHGSSNALKTYFNVVEEV